MAWGLFEFEAINRAALAATASPVASLRALCGTTAKVIDQIPDGTRNFAYVDGDHTLRTLTHDLLLVLRRIRAGGVIGGDDCCPTAWQHGTAYEPTMVSRWVASFAEAIRSPITILPGNRFRIEKRGDGFALFDESGARREWSVPAHLNAAIRRVPSGRPITRGRRPACPRSWSFPPLSIASCPPSATSKSPHDCDCRWVCPQHARIV